MAQLLPPTPPTNGLGGSPQAATGPDPGGQGPKAPGASQALSAPAGAAPSAMSGAPPAPPDDSGSSDDSATISSIKANPDRFEQLDGFYGLMKKKLGVAKELDKLFTPLAEQGDQAKPKDFIEAFGKAVGKELMTPKKAADTLVGMPQEPGQALAAWAKAWEQKVKAVGGVAMMAHQELRHNTLTEAFKRLGMIATAQQFHKHVMAGKDKAKGQGGQGLAQPILRVPGASQGPGPSAGPMTAGPLPAAGAPPNG